MSQTQQKTRACEKVSREGRQGHTKPFILMVAAIAIACVSTGSAAAQALNASSSPNAGASLVSTTYQTMLGEVIPFGSGTARSWVNLDEAGKPTAVGITMTEGALNGLPADVTPGMIWMVEYLLAFPSDIPLLPFNHIGVNWNPKGHPPMGIYNVPHFDFHFYLISPEERSQITARGDDLEKCKTLPPAAFLPEGYVFPPDAEEPGMGGHWIDPVSHEFHGEAFTNTFIYGSYDGKVIFYEPMITKALLESKPAISLPIGVPQAFAQAGYFPTSYSVRYDAKRKEYTIALEGLTLRMAS